MREKLKKYGWALLVALDQLANTVLGGYPDETFSARAYRKALAGQPFWRLLRGLIDILFFWERDHCRKSYESELAQNHAPERKEVNYE